MTTKVTTKVVKISKERLEDLRELGFLSEEQIQKMIEHDFISGKNRNGGRRMMETSNGGFTHPHLTFKGNGKETPYTSSMVELKKEVNEVIEKYTTVQVV